MVQIAPLDRSHLPQVLALVNSHLSTVIPGWSLTADYFLGAPEERAAGIQAVYYPESGRLNIS